MMEQELEDRLRQTSKDHLLLLIQELTQRYPLLHSEIAMLLERGVVSSRSPLSSNAGADILKLEDVYIDDEWNFGNEETENSLFGDVELDSFDPEPYKKRIEEYLPRLQNGESLQALTNDLYHITEDAAIQAEQQDFRGALVIYALFIEERLAERDPQLVQLFDQVIDNSMPILETLLSEASSNIAMQAASLTPLLTTEMRQQWLQRLFALWLRRLDECYGEENLSEIMLNVAWSEDVALLRALVQQELQRQPASEPSNIVDFTQQYRVRTLEKFMKELPLM